MENIVKLFEDFYRYAGLKLNIYKTEIIWLGRNNRCGKICNIKITQEPVKVHGILISKNPHEIQTLNLDQRIDKLKTILNAWKQRGLTIKGKIAIVKAKALPLITYVANFICVPKDVIETIDKLLGLRPNSERRLFKILLASICKYRFDTWTVLPTHWGIRKVML